MLTDLLEILKDKFLIYPDQNYIFASSSTFTNFFASLLITVNRTLERVIIPSRDYEFINEVLSGYENILNKSLSLQYTS